MKLHSTASVLYETQILEKGEVVTSRQQKRNLLLDSGLDGIAVRSWWAAFSHCVLGSGTTPTKRDSGAITVTISGEVATASANFFESGDVGRLLKLDTGQEVYITAHTSATEVAVAGATDEAASEFAIWYVDETGHENELVRTNNLGTDSGDVSSTWDGSKIEHKRTFIFPAETESRTYREIGWSHTASAGGNLLGRDLIPGGGDSISEGKQYKVVVRLQVTPTPIAQIDLTDVGTGGFATTGKATIVSLSSAFDGIGGGIFGVSVSLEPSGTGKRVYLNLEDFTLQENATTSNIAPEVGVITAKSMVPTSYNLKSFHRDFVYKLSPGEFNGTVYGIGFGAGNFRKFFGVKFDAPQTKDSDHTLQIVFRFSWGRTLTN